MNENVTVMNACSGGFVPQSTFSNKKGKSFLIVDISFVSNRFRILHFCSLVKDLYRTGSGSPVSAWVWIVKNETIIGYNIYSFLSKTHHSDFWESPKAILRPATMLGSQRWRLFSSAARRLVDVKMRRFDTLKTTSLSSLLSATPRPKICSSVARFVHGVNEQVDLDEALKKIRPTEKLSQTEARDALNKLVGEDRKRLDIIKLEYEVLLASGAKVPEHVSDELWWELYTHRSERQRKNVLRFHFKKELYEMKDKRRKELNAQERLLPRVPLYEKTENGFTYTLGDADGAKNTIFLKILKTTMDKHYYANVYNSMMYGSQLVFDMSYDSYMRDRDVTNLIEQLLECHGFNKTDENPFYFHFCNLKKGSISHQRFCASAQSSTRPLEEYPFSVTEKHYLDIFPKERLVYLTPQAPNMLEKFDRNDVYIIGGLVDKVINKPVSLAKAKREGLRTAKFPFDLYMKWDLGTKTITLDQAVKILLEVKNSGSWRKAFNHVPKRKRTFFDEM